MWPIGWYPAPMIAGSAGPSRRDGPFFPAKGPDRPGRTEESRRGCDLFSASRRPWKRPRRRDRDRDARGGPRRISPSARRSGSVGRADVDDEAFCTGSASPSPPCPSSRALAQADAVAGTTFLHSRAIQTITLLAGTPFNPTGSDIVVEDLFGDGGITLNRDAQVGTSMDVGSATGLYYGSNALLGDYVFGGVPLKATDFGGSITNIVQAPDSSLTSGDLVFGEHQLRVHVPLGPSGGDLAVHGPVRPVRLHGPPRTACPPRRAPLCRTPGADVLNILFNGQIVAELRPPDPHHPRPRAVSGRRPWR